jgi:hypothetical protein
MRCGPESRGSSDNHPDDVEIHDYAVAHSEITFNGRAYVLMQGSLRRLCYRRKDLIHAPR